jgi:putative heme iron utilization protein
MYAGFADFGFFAIRPRGAHLVAGFGRIVDLKPEQFLTETSDAHALLAEENGIIAHMNADHLGTMRLYAQALGATDGDWRCTGCDPEGLDLQAGTTTLRLNFPQRVTTPAALRNALRQLADQARSAAKLDPHQSAGGE